MSTRALERAIGTMGGQSAMARVLAERTGKPIRQGHIWAWIHRTKKVPPEIAPHIEAATEELGERVGREELCPDFPWGSSVESPPTAAA
jgi:DNA-binding transcriptional regulator YdaS (Cro superfamily)